jgi:hypothetical protein
MRISDRRNSAWQGRSPAFRDERVDDSNLTCVEGESAVAHVATSTLRRACVVGLLAVTMLAAVSFEPAQAHFRRYRQYYGGWSYNPIQTYYYRPYYYQTYVSAPRYSYHYVVYYPAQTQYYYYYNPAQNYYWGRYDRKSKGYSLLAEKDRKANLAEIPESAFPEPSKMPNIPESTDGVAMEPAPDDAPKDVPADPANGVAATQN